MLCKPAYPLHSTRTAGNGFPGKCGHQGHRKRPPAAYSFCLWSISPALPCSDLWDWTSISPLFHEMGSLVLLTVICKPDSAPLHFWLFLINCVLIIWLLLLQIWSCVLNPGLYLLDPNLSPNTNPILIFTSWFSLLLFLILRYIYWLTAFYDLPMSAHERQHNRED